jgi:uracil-DNA glycosylase
MPFDARQHALLQAMGLKVWQATPEVPAASAAPAAAAASLSHKPGELASPPPPLAAPVVTTPAISTARPVPVTTQAPSDVARRTHIATLGWAELKAAVAGCRSCGLADSRTQTVFGTGHAQAQWLLVGEAPGEQEDIRGEPFVGAAGQLLDQMLRAIGLSRADEGPPEQRVFIVNTLKCRPPRNRNPSDEELAQCAPHLQRQVELLRPRIVLAMGRFAVQALLQTHEPIGRLRGRVHRAFGLPTVVTYHPAYLLRNLADKQRAWEDLCLAAQTHATLGVNAVVSPP